MVGARGGRRRRWRCSRPSRLAWLIEDEEDNVAELLGASGLRGVASGRGYGERRRQLRSGLTGKRGKREPTEGERSRGRGENEGRLWVSPWHRLGGPGKQEVAHGGARGRQAAACLLWREEAGGWHGPAQCWAGQRAARWAASGKVFSALFYFFLLFCFI